MECLDEETILAFCRGGLPADVRARAQEHIGTCDECRALVSAVARSSFADTPRSDRPAHPGAGGSSIGGDIDPEEREDRPRGPLLRPKLDPAMAPTTPVGGAGYDGTPRASASPVQPGEILAGKFEVERVLGAGGMGIVVAARHTQLDQRVALKFLLPVACEVPGAVARFLREGKAAARITSEHVARVMDTGVLDAGDARGAPYLVMEYLEGSDLGAVVQRRGRVSADEAIEYVLQACEAIVEAHDLGIVHRDLKPANLFLSKRADGSPLVKVLDFGISKLEGGGSRSQLTSASVLMGSPRYMSPEQMLSAKDVDARTDVWALGVILYELVTGKPVWHADTMQGLCALIASSPAPSLRALAPDAPHVLDDVVSRCLAKSRDARIASVADLALALEPIAPATARTSIDRILRVARRERGVGGTSRRPEGGPIPKAPSAAVASADATTNDARRGAAPRTGTILAIAVAALLVAGIAVNAALVQRDPRVTSDLGAGASAKGPSIGPAVGAPVVGVPAVSVPAVAASALTTSATASSAAPALAASATSTGATALAGSGALVPLAPGSASVARRLLRAPTATTGTTAPPASAVAGDPTTATTAKVEPKTTPSGSSRALTDRK
jgi:serine/threonine protein kinase